MTQKQKTRPRPLGGRGRSYYLFTPWRCRPPSCTYRSFFKSPCRPAPRAVIPCGLNRLGQAGKPVLPLHIFTHLAKPFNNRTGRFVEKKLNTIRARSGQIIGATADEKEPSQIRHNDGKIFMLIFSINYPQYFKKIFSQITNLIR